MARYTYQVEIPKGSMDHLRWLSDRGYDAGFYELGTICDETPTHEIFSFTEPEAWEFNEASLGEAFLTCCADPELRDALNGFINRIV